MNAKQLGNCGGKVDDSLLKMWFLKGLGSDYTMVKFQCNTAGSSLEQTYVAVMAYAATDPKITGSTHPARNKRRDRATAAQEANPDAICRQFARTGECTYGAKCRFQNTKTPRAANKESTS